MATTSFQGARTEALLSSLKLLFPQQLPLNPSARSAIQMDPQTHPYPAIDSTFF